MPYYTPYEMNILLHKIYNSRMCVEYIITFINIRNKLFILALSIAADSWT